MELRTFVNAFIRIPVQIALIVRQGRRLIYRVLALSP